MTSLLACNNVYSTSCPQSSPPPSHSCTPIPHCTPCCPLRPPPDLPLLDPFTPSQHGLPRECTCDPEALKPSFGIYQQLYMADGEGSTKSWWNASCRVHYSHSDIRWCCCAICSICVPPASFHHRTSIKLCLLNVFMDGSIFCMDFMDRHFSPDFFFMDS